MLFTTSRLSKVFGRYRNRNKHLIDTEHTRRNREASVLDRETTGAGRVAC
jgi:hypothetical protein